MSNGPSQFETQPDKTRLNTVIGRGHGPAHYCNCILKKIKFEGRSHWLLFYCVAKFYHIAEQCYLLKKNDFSPIYLLSCT